MSLGQRITELRTAAGISQHQLAKDMEVSRQAVSKWESDQSAPDSLKLIRLAELLDTDIEYLATGRKTYGRRPPVVLKTTETIEKVVEKPVVQDVETVVETVVEKPVVQYVEKPVIRKVYRTRLVRNPMELLLVGLGGLIAGFLIGLLF